MTVSGCSVYKAQFEEIYLNFRLLPYNIKTSTLKNATRLKTRLNVGIYIASTFRFQKHQCTERALQSPNGGNTRSLCSIEAASERGVASGKRERMLCR